jgi:hypothetical protein
VTTYDQGSPNPLYVNPPKLIRIKALSTWDYRLARWGADVKWVITVVGVGGLATIGGWLWPRVRRRLHKHKAGGKDEAKPEHPEPEHPGSEEPEAAAPTGQPSQ